jgi:hypothetical protein
MDGDPKGLLLPWRERKREKKEIIVQPNYIRHVVVYLYTGTPKGPKPLNPREGRTWPPPLSAMLLAVMASAPPAPLVRASIPRFVVRCGPTTADPVDRRRDPMAPKCRR